MMSETGSISSVDFREELCATGPIGLLCELTHRCPLQCPYCSNPLELDRSSQELSTSQWLDILEQAAKIGILQIHLSGGEPTARKDLEQIVAKAAELGLYSNLITAGVLLDKARLQALYDAGLDHVQLSFQDTISETADRIAGFKGHDKKLQVARWVRELGIPLTLNAPMHRQNIEHTAEFIDLAVKIDAARLEVAHVQYYGWAYRNRAALIPTYEQTMASAKVVEEARQRLKGILTIDFVIPDYYAARPKPCMGGWGRGIMNITPSGKVLPCHAAESITGLTFDNIRDNKLVDIWVRSDAFNKYRGTDWMPELCKSCDQKEIDWGGCRCQAFAITGNAAETDPACKLSSRHEELVGIAQAEAARGAPEFIYRTIGKADKIGSAV